MTGREGRERHRISGEYAEEDGHPGPAIETGEGTPLAVLFLYRRRSGVRPAELIEVVLHPGRGRRQEEPDEVVRPHGQAQQPEEARYVVDPARRVQVRRVGERDQVVEEVRQGGEDVEENAVQGGDDTMRGNAEDEVLDRRYVVKGDTVDIRRSWEDPYSTVDTVDEEEQEAGYGTSNDTRQGGGGSARGGWRQDGRRLLQGHLEVVDDAV